MSEQEMQPKTDVATMPLPIEVTEHPAWRLIWQKLLAPTPDELEPLERDDVDRDVA